MTIEVPWDLEIPIHSSDVEPEAERIADELIVVAEALDPAEELRFLRTLISKLQAEEREVRAVLSDAKPSSKLVN